jgi:hypothetical protein
MHDTTVKMKDGRVFCAPIYYFRPTEGWMSLIDNDVPDKLYFRDMESATTENQRMTKNNIGTCDELERARGQGWDGT